MIINVYFNFEKVMWWFGLEGWWTRAPDYQTQGLRFDSRQCHNVKYIYQAQGDSAFENDYPG